jgi:hypothetical protein
MKVKALKKKIQIKYLKDFIAIDLINLDNILVLGLNIVKNLVDLTQCNNKASNRKDQKGASMEIIFPKAYKEFY